MSLGMGERKLFCIPSSCNTGQMQAVHGLQALSAAYLECSDLSREVRKEVQILNVQ